MNRWTPRCLLNSCYPFVILEVLVFPCHLPPCFALMCFNRESSRYPALKEIICWSHASLKILSVPSVATLSPSTNIRMSVSKGVPQTHKHPGNLALHHRSRAPSLPTQVSCHHRPIKTSQPQNSLFCLRRAVAWA